MYNYTLIILKTFHSAAKRVHGTKKSQFIIFIAFFKKSVSSVYNITKDTKKCKT